VPILIDSSYLFWGAILVAPSLYSVVVTTRPGSMNWLLAEVLLLPCLLLCALTIAHLPMPKRLDYFGVTILLFAYSLTLALVLYRTRRGEQGKANPRLLVLNASLIGFLAVFLGRGD